MHFFTDIIFSCHHVLTTIDSQVVKKYIFHVLSIQLPLPGYGMGRTVQLKEKITIEDAIARVKKHLEIPHLRLALARKTTLSKKVL